MELRQLRYFVAVVEAGTVTGAAEQLAMSQPPLTMQLHNLEEPYMEVFLLHALGDVPLKDVSRLFGKSDSWARVTYYRAKAMIARRWKEEYDGTSGV